MKNAYLFDPKTLEPIGVVECQVCQITGNMLTPPNALYEAPPKYAEFVIVRAVEKKKWEVDLDASISKALEKVDKLHAESLLKVTGNSTSEERDTWAQKAAAARAILNGSASPSQVAMVSIEGDEKGLSPEEMASRIINNAAIFELIVGKAAAFRAKARKAIRDCQSVEDLCVGMLNLSKLLADEINQLGK